MTYLIPLIIIGLFLGGYFFYMKFYYPKYKEKWESSQKEVDQEWQENKEEILNEYFTDPNRFGLISDVTQGEKIIGIISGKLPDSFKSKAKEAIVGAITFTKKVDMAAYYLVATDKGLHYTGFDGEKCFLHEVFDYNHIMEKKMTNTNFSFVYKNEKFPFSIQQMIEGFPRFNVHERSQTPNSSNRATNFFVREYLAYEPTDNTYYKQTGSIIPKINTGMMGKMASKEGIKDAKIRAYLLEGFKKKLGVFV